MTVSKPGANILVEIDEADFAIEEAYARVRQLAGADLGAVASFVGLVRDRNAGAGDGSEVNTLTLEHFPGMTERSIEQIAATACERWPLLALHIYHRVGELQPTDQIVMVIAGAGHRVDAFAAAEFVMDYLKTDAILWKKEVSRAGEQWLESTASDHARAKAWNDPLR